MSFNKCTLSLGGDFYGAISNFLEFKNSSYSYFEYLTLKSSIFPNFVLNSIEFLLINLSNNFCSYINAFLFFNFIVIFILIFILSNILFNKFNNKILWSLFLSISITFSPYNVWHFLSGHYGFNLFFTLLLIYFYIQRIFNNIILNNIFVFIFLFFSFVFNPYNAICIATIYFVYFCFNFKYLSNYLISDIKKIFIPLSILIIFSYSKILFESSSHSQTLFYRPDSSVWGVLPWMYFLPPPSHLFVSDGYLSIFRSFMLIGNVPENSTYLGIFNIFLLFILIIKRNLIEIPKYSLFFYKLFFISFLLSLPPRIPFFDYVFYTPSYLLHMVLPLFRIYNRFSIFAFIFLSIASILLVSNYIGKYQPKYRAFIISIITFISFIDFFPKINYFIDPIIQIDRFKIINNINSNNSFYIYPIGLTVLKNQDDFQLYKINAVSNFYKRKLLNDEVSSLDTLNDKCLFLSRKVSLVLLDKKIMNEGLVPSEYKPYVGLKASNLPYLNDPCQLSFSFTPISEDDDFIIYRNNKIGSTINFKN
jgi:hypothetical protein